MNGILRYVRRHHLGMLALFIALGGTSYAAVSLPRNSVGATQIKAGAVRSSEVKDRSLTARDFRSGQLPKGKRGARGAAGERGQTGSQGPQGVQGPAGVQGPKGDTGARGQTGPQGPAGPVESFAVRLRRTSDTLVVPHSATAGANTAIQFTDVNSVQYDVGGFFDPTRAVSPPYNANAVIRIPRTGTYVVTAAARWTTNGDGFRSLAISGPQETGGLGGLRAQSTVPANPAAATAQNVATTERFSEGALVFASVGQSSGADLTLDASQNQVHLSAAFVGP